jgi:pimeloyl-ACP methyl ester carboxylesterase
MTIRCEHVPTPRLRVHVRQAGDGEPVLLLHGWPEWSRIWEPVMQRLHGQFHLVAPDLRGFGESDKGPPGPSTDADAGALAEDLWGLVDTLGVERFGIVAHDVGSFVAQVMARHSPERISGLFFFNCAYPGIGAPGIGARWVEPSHLGETWYQQFHQKPWAAELVGSSRDACRIYLREFLRHWAHREDAFDEVLEEWVDNFMRPGNLQGGFNWYRSNHASRMAVVQGTSPPPPPIELPTRVLWGEHDPVLPLRWADRLQEFFPRLRFDAAPDAGHFVHWETPDAAAHEIRAFFDGLTA